MIVDVLFENGLSVSPRKHLALNIFWFTVRTLKKFIFFDDLLFVRDNLKPIASALV